MKFNSSLLLTLLSVTSLSVVTSFTASNKSVTRIPMTTTSSSKTITTSSNSELYMNKKRSGGKKKKKGGGGSKGFAGALRELQKSSFQYAGSIVPAEITPQRVVMDESIMKPDYAIDGRVSD